MRRIVSNLILGLALALAVAPAPALADDEPWLITKTLDVAVVRPVSMTLSFASLGVYLGISPLVTIMGIGEETARAMVLAPWRFTSAREIGRLGRYRDDGGLVEDLDREARRLRY